MRNKAEVICDIVRCLGVGMVGSGLVFVIPALLFLSTERNPYEAFLLLVAVLGMVLLGIALLTAERIMEK